MKTSKLCLIGMGIFASVMLSGCGKSATNRVSIEDARPGRDRELFEDALKDIKKGRHERGRIELNTLINTYADSKFIAAARLATADSFFLEGGTSNLAQAEVEYNNWLEFFPTDPNADDVLLQIARIHMKQIEQPGRDRTEAEKAESALRRLIQQYPNSDLIARAKSDLIEVQEILAKSDLKVAQFYFNDRKAFNASVARLKELLSKYPNFSLKDQVLDLLGRALTEQENTEEAATYFQQLLAEYPNSSYRERAENYLQRFEKEIPQASGDQHGEVARNELGLRSKLIGVVFGPHFPVERSGVLIKEDGIADQKILDSLEAISTQPTTAPNSVTSSVGSPSTGTGPVTTATPGAPAGANRDVKVGVGKPGEGAVTPATDSSSADPNAKAGQPKADAGKDAKKPDDKKKNDKKKDDKKKKDEKKKPDNPQAAQSDAKKSN